MYLIEDVQKLKFHGIYLLNSELFKSTLNNLPTYQVY